ncbi:putative calcium/proton exchanger [Paratrimastix pyriformis]|uniref:Calcium/proton exchanger n=1 Tax=Paratrimastix pyriformis TaxID=342808 RepID=A0ABQ8UKY3_9EUKA|nr:putative calcium/proton exchanger [Paratrimastix pyriformis]
MFGFKKTRHILRRRRLDERSEKVRSLHEPVSGIRANANPERFITIGNVLYLAFFGWWLALAHLILGGLLALTVVGMDHARICFSLADYLWWPFGKYIERGTHLRSAGFTTLELQSLMKTRNLSPRLKVASVLWWVLFAPLSCLFSGLAALISWMMIFYIPTSKVLWEVIKLMWLPLSLSPTVPLQVLWEVIKLMWRQPLHLHIGNGNPPIDSEVLVRHVPPPACSLASRCACWLCLLLAVLAAGCACCCLCLLLAVLAAGCACCWLCLLLAVLAAGCACCWLCLLLAVLAAGCACCWLCLLLAVLAAGCACCWLCLLLPVLAAGCACCWLCLLLAVLAAGCACCCGCACCWLCLLPVLAACPAWACCPCAALSCVVGHFVFPTCPPHPLHPNPHPPCVLTQVCTYSAVNLYYYKLTVSGINIVIFMIFVLSLISIMPLASIIGMAISSISAQTNFAVGALLNATFGSIIELILYVDAFRYGHTDLILQGISGGLFCNLLFLPGMAMVFGGIKYKEQRFNSLTAGVSSMMLIIATVGMFFPTVFYTLRGSTTLQCTNCTMAEGKLDCSGGCLTDRLADLMQDPIYRKAGQPLEFAVAGILLLAYIVGMVFTLKTHAYMYSLDPRHLAEEADEAAEGGNAGGGEEDEAQGGPAGAEEALLAEEHERDAASHQRGRSSAHQQGAPFLSLLEPANVGDATNTSDLEPVPVAVTHPSVTTAPALSEPTLAQLVPASLAPAATTTSTSYQSDPLSLSLGTDPALDRPLSAAMAGLTPAASPSKEPILPGSRQFSLEGLGSAPAMPATGTAALVSSGGAAAQQQQMAQSGRPKKKKAEASHEDAPEWSKLKCVIVLACGVGSFAVIAEKMTGVLEPALKAVGVSESFAGITLIGLIPSMAEIINAIQFGLHDHISLSLEIGMSSAVQTLTLQTRVRVPVSESHFSPLSSTQIAMVEVPFVIFMGAFAGQRDLAAIWPDLDMFGVFISVLIITYMSIDGRSNYFEGSALVLLYMTLVAAYFFWNQV